MKKIFAIALALTMVLSMGVAAAATCNYSWDSSPVVCRTGVPTIEVVEFVRQTTDCGTELVENSCAVAMENERAYYGIKLVVPADIDENWWTLAGAVGLKVAYTNLETRAVAADGTVTATALTEQFFNLPEYADVKKGGTWWLNTDATPVTAAGGGAATFTPDTDQWTKNASFKASTNVFEDKWVNRGCAKVKASITVDSVDQTMFSALGWTIIWDDDADTLSFVKGSYANETAAEAAITDATADSVVLNLVKDVVDNASVTPEDGDPVVLVGYADKANNSYSDNDPDTAPFGQGCDEGKLLYTIFSTFGLDFQNKTVTNDNIQANFGYDLSISDTSNFATKGTAIVDVNCSIEIPKTGDVSVIAYAVMALVTAAGAVSLKK